MKKFKIYKILNENYYHLLFNKNNVNYEMKKEYRRYIGFVGIELNGMKYAIPLLSDTNNKYRSIHKYSILIPDENGNKLGILRISKMIPIIDNEHFIKSIDMNSLDYQDGIRLFKELEFLNQPHIYDEVYQLANEIYKKRNYIPDAVNFKFAEFLMYEYAIDLYKKQLLNFEEILFTEGYGKWYYSELNKYRKENNIDCEDTFMIIDADSYRVELLKHPDGHLELVEERWDSTKNDENGKPLYTIPRINTANGIAGEWSKQQIQNMSKQELMDSIAQTSWLSKHFDDYQDDLEEFYEDLSRQLDEWDIDFVNHQNQVQ